MMGYYNRKPSTIGKKIVIIITIVVFILMLIGFFKCFCAKPSQVTDKKEPVKISMQQAAKIMTSSIDTSKTSVPDEINILALGLDTRAGYSKNMSRADAIILFTVHPRTAKFEILAFGRDMEVDTVSVVDKQGKPLVNMTSDNNSSDETETEKNEEAPEDTKEKGSKKEAKEAKEDTTKPAKKAVAKKTPANHMDKIAHVYLETRGGREKLIKVVEKLSHKKVDYYAEVSFSQIIGLMNYLGLNGVDALKYLRHRKSSLAPNTFQRAMNQATFIRYAAIKYFPRAAQYKRTFIIGAFSYLTTNMQPDLALGVVALLEKRGLRKENFDVSVFNYSSVKDHDYDPNKVSEYLKDWQAKHIPKSDSDFKIAARIHRAVREYEDGEKEIKDLTQQKPTNKKDRAARSQGIVAARSKMNQAAKRARNFYEQQLWWQEPDKSKQDAAKKELCTFIEQYYKKQIEIAEKNMEKENLTKKQTDKWKQVRKESEEGLKQLALLTKQGETDIRTLLPPLRIIGLQKKAS